MPVGKRITKSHDSGLKLKVGGELLENSQWCLSFAVFVIETLVESLPNQPKYDWATEEGEEGNFDF